MKNQTQNFGGVKLINFTELSESDVHNVLHMRNHPDIKKWMYNQQQISLSEHLAFLQQLNNDQTKLYVLVMQDKIMLGVFYLTEISFVNGSAEIGLFTNPNVLIPRKGSTILSLAISYAFESLKLNLLKLEVFTNNDRAINLYKRYGFKSVSTSQRHDQSITFMNLQKAIE